MIQNSAFFELFFQGLPFFMARSTRLNVCMIYLGYLLLGRNLSSNVIMVTMPCNCFAVLIA